MKHNPYFPNRKIRHADTMIAAGFEINLAWYKDKTPAENSNVSKLIYWKHKQFKDIDIILFDYQQISLENLVKRIRSQLIYNFNKNSRVEKYQ